MGKIVRHTMVIIISETWTMTWADGTQRTVICRSRQFYQALSSYADDSQVGNDLEANTADSDQSKHDAGTSK
jgi:hypothetical protein